MISLHPPLVCLLSACSDLISSLQRQGQARQRRNTRDTSVEIAISKSSPPPKSTNNKVPTAKGGQHYPKIHLSASSLHSCNPETSRKFSNVEAACPNLALTTSIEQQWQFQNATQSTLILLTSIIITSVLPLFQKQISSVI